MQNKVDTPEKFCLYSCAMTIITYPFTAASFENSTADDLANIIWEDYRNLHGVKPRHMSLWGKPKSELIDDAVYYANASHEQFEAEKQAKRDRQEDKMRKANAKAQAARVFDRSFNALSQAFG